MVIRRFLSGISETVSIINNPVDIIQNIVDEKLIPFILHLALGIVLLVGSIYVLWQALLYLYRWYFGPAPVVLPDWEKAAGDIKTALENISTELSEIRGVLTGARDPLTAARLSMPPLRERMTVDDLHQ